jgi:hypothetical protein
MALAGGAGVMTSAKESSVKVRMSWNLEGAAHARELQQNTSKNTCAAAHEDARSGPHSQRQDRRLGAVHSRRCSGLAACQSGHQSACPSGGRAHYFVVSEIERKWNGCGM